jgi:hypothetical protein
MARKLKVYRASLGFFDLAVAAPSMKAAAKAWGSDPDIFKRGFAEQTEDPEIVEAALASPGVVLRRPVGSQGSFSKKAALPKAPKAGSCKEPARPSPDEGGNEEPDSKAEENVKRQEAAAREKEEKRLAAERRKREADEARATRRREKMIAKADAALERARARHEEAMQSLARRRSELDREEAREEELWQREQRDHRDALKEAGS